MAEIQECVRWPDAKFIPKALEKYMISLRKIKGYDADIASMKKTKVKIEKVLKDSDRNDIICFYAKVPLSIVSKGRFIGDEEKNI